jgi:putative FmdB family regulatory protein
MVFRRLELAGPCPHLSFPVLKSVAIMPIYAYRCGACGHQKDVLQKMSDPTLTVCPSCGAESFAKQLSAPNFQLKGTGWYVTDFRDNGKKANGDSGKAATADDAGGKTAGDTSDGKAGGTGTEIATPAVTPAAVAAPATPSAATSAPAGGASAG